MRFRSVALVGVMALALTMFTPADSSAEGRGGDSVGSGSSLEAIAALSDDMPDVPPADGSVTLNPAQLADMATMAEDDGISLDEAIARYGWHEPFSIVVERIRSTHPDDFAGARIEPDRRPWIAFKGDVPKEAAVAIDGFVRPVEMIGDRGFTEADLDRRLAAAHFAAMGMSDLVSDASSGYDIATGIITVEVEPVQPLTSDGARAILAATMRSRDATALDGIDLRVVDAIISGDDTNVYGGFPLSPSCTSGFTVKNGNNSIRALTTAGHCGNSRSYPPSVTMTFQGEHDGYWGDVQWHTTSGTERDDFYADLGVRRDVSGVGDRTEGQSLCRYGAATGKECDTVYQRHHCVGSRCHLTIMHNREAASGDSGGPWFYGNTAYGIHSGNKWYWAQNRDTFTPAVYVDEAIGLFIATY